MSRTRKQPTPKPLGTLEHPLGGLLPDAEFTPNDREFSVFDELARTGAVPEVPPAPIPQTPVVGSEATITLIGEPDFWLVKSDDNSFTFNGDVRFFLASLGVETITLA